MQIIFTQIYLTDRSENKGGIIIAGRSISNYKINEEVTTYTKSRFEVSNSSPEEVVSVF